MASSPETIADLGEFGLIARLVEIVAPARADTLVGAGDDDTAVLRAADGSLQLATLDTLVEDVHFVRGESDPRDVGARLAAVNASDIAAMGGRPTHALAAMVAPGDLPVEFALAVVEGLVATLRRFGADLVGGNLARGDRLVLDLALLGEVDESRLLPRSGARPGDAVVVTGALGAAAAARAVRLRERHGTPVPLPDAARARAFGRWWTPEPRLSVAQLLRPLGATAAIDISDGLAADLGHVCERSGVGVRLEAAAIPVDPAATAIGAALGVDALGWALRGGEDYELLVTVEAARAADLCARVTAETGVVATVIGRVTRGPSRELTLPDGAETELAGGWRHFG